MMNYLEKKKKAMLNYVSGGGRLPSEYQEVEYIDTNNKAITQDDLVYNNSHTFRYELDTQLNAIDGSKYQGIDAGCAISAWSSSEYHQGSGRFSISGSTLDRNTIEIEATNGTSYYTIYHNGTQIGSSSRGNSNLATYSGGNGYPIGFRSRSSISASNIKVYELKIYIDNVLERDYIPCYRKSDNKVGLYDIVGRNFITTINQYEFVKGNDV